MKITKERVEQLVSEMPDIYKQFCPRCGRGMSKYPALSRYANVHICSDCGTEEAMNDFCGIKNDFSKWTM